MPFSLCSIKCFISSSVFLISSSNVHACGNTEDVSLTSVFLSHLFPLMSVRVSVYIYTQNKCQFWYAGTQIVGRCSVFLNEKQQIKCIARSQLWDSTCKKNIQFQFHILLKITVFIETSSSIPTGRSVTPDAMQIPRDVKKSTANQKSVWAGLFLQVRSTAVDKY